MVCTLLQLYPHLELHFHHDLTPQIIEKVVQGQRQNKRTRLTKMNQIESIAAMTANSAGVGILPNRFTQQYFGERLKQISNAPVYKKPLCLAYRPQMKNVQSIRIVLNEIRALVAGAFEPPIASNQATPLR